MLSKIAQSIFQHFWSTKLCGSLTGLYFQRAPQEQDSPYGVFYITSMYTEDFLGATATNEKRIHHADVQFTLVSSADDGGAEIGLILNELYEGFDFAKLAMEGHYIVKMERVATTSITYADEIWQAVTNYEIWFVKE